MATRAQISFLEILLNDCGFGVRSTRNAFVSAECDRDIRFLDELTLGEASQLISDLKRRREENKKKPRVDDDD
jgi:hypothetical protein